MKGPIKPAIGVGDARERASGLEFGHQLQQPLLRLRLAVAVAAELLHQVADLRDIRGLTLCAKSLQHALERGRHVWIGRAR